MIIKALINCVCWVAATVIVLWLYELFKALKDPDVKNAADLRITIKRFKKYERLYDSYWDAMMKYGPNSPQADEYFDKQIWPQIDVPNEWRRYQNFRANQDKTHNSLKY